MPVEMEINKSKLTTAVRWKVHTNLHFHVLIFVSQSMQYDILWFVVYVPKRRHLLHQVPFPSCSYPHWISSATNNNPTKMIFWGQSQCHFLVVTTKLIQTNWTRQILVLKAIFWNLCPDHQRRHDLSSFEHKFASIWTFICQFQLNFEFGSLFSSFQKQIKHLWLLWTKTKQNLWLDAHCKPPVDLGNDRGKSLGNGYFPLVCWVSIQIYS